MLIFTYFIPTYGLLYLLFTLLVNLLFTVKKIFDLLLTLNNLLVNFHLLTSKNHEFVLVQSPASLVRDNIRCL